MKLSHFPGREEMRRLRERWDREDADDVPLHDFDTTLTSTLDSTLNLLAPFHDRAGPSVERDKLRDQAVTELRAEVVELRKLHATTVATLNIKASKAALSRFETAIVGRIDKRIDNIFKLVAALGAILGVLIAVKGR